MKLEPLHYAERGVTFIRDHPQLLVTILLAIVIPVAFLINGQQFLAAGRENQETLEKERIGILHDVLVSFIRSTHYDIPEVQRELEYLKASNPDITQFHIVKEEGSRLRIVASGNIDEVGTLIENTDAYLTANVSPNTSIITPYAQNGVRYWQSFRVLKSEGYPDHYIFTEVSLERIDTLFAARIITAYYWLIGLLCIILYLLFRHVRLIDYAYLYREVKQANEMKDLFTNMIAHELRAPLTAMRGYASMIRERHGVDEVTVKNASEIEQAAGRLITIVSDLLDVARIQSGKLRIESGAVHLSGLVRSVVESLAPSARTKGIELSVRETGGSVLLTSDEKRLYQALTNILSNSIKYTEKGSIEIELSTLSDRVEIRVKDTGMGISSENQKKLFAPFFRVHDEKVSEITGTGLGMWITKEIIDLLGGSIGVESIKGVGTHVVVTLPITPKKQGVGQDT